MNSNEKSGTSASSAVQKVKAKDAPKPISSSQVLEELDKRLNLLLERVATLETSLNQLNTTFSANKIGEDEEDDDDWEFNDLKDSKEDTELKEEEV